MGRVPGSDQPPILTARAFANIADYELRSWYAQWDTSIPGLGRTVRRVSEARFERILDDYAADVVFVHAGLGAVKRAFDRNPYEYLRNVLVDRFGSVLTSGFTPSFRKSGIYHKEHSRPEYGAFARQFLADADYRTNDAIHSILVKGDYRFEDSIHHDTFGPGGCWAQLDAENVLYCNVGTPWIVATQHHFIEHERDVPYNRPVDYDGVICDSNGEAESWTQRNYEYDIPAKRNARKIHTRLRRHGTLDHFELDGLRMNFFRAGDLRRALEPEIENDPYYLIT